MKRNYLKPTNLYQEADSRLQQLYIAREKLMSRLSNYPDGKIHISDRGTKIQYYLRTDPKDRTGVYLPKREERKIKNYLQKKYDESAIKQVNAEIKRLEYLLKNPTHVIKLQNLYSAHPQEIKNFLNPIDISDKDYVKEWLSIPYDRKPIPDELQIYRTDRGEQVRSKSELNIANMLSKMKVPYKYECPLALSNGRILHPDFTLLDIGKRREVYWEHRGMMDDRAYLKHTVQRVKDYQKEGIYTGENLILTEETSTLPLGTEEIKNIIKHFKNT